MHLVQAAGPTGWLFFVLIYATCCILFIPASILAICAGAIYGFWTGVLLVLAGNGLGSVLCLLVTRYLFRERMADWIHRHPRIKAIKCAVARDDWKLVFLTRLSPFLPFTLINYALGLTSISALRFFLATEVGALPAISLYVYLGTLMGKLATIGPELRQPPPVQWIYEAAGLLVTIAVTYYVTRLAQRALDHHLKHEEKGTGIA